MTNSGMGIADGWRDYEVLGTGNGEKLERWGNVILLRPDPQVIWRSKFDLAAYKGLNARYTRSSSGGGYWEKLKPYAEEWKVSYKDLTFSIKPMGFKHTGLFPEQSYNWDSMREQIENARREIRVLNLFAYTGGATVACAKSGAIVTHVDAARGMVDRAKENCSLSGIAQDRVRYIVDDCNKFVAREIKRGKRYDAATVGRRSANATYGASHSVDTAVQVSYALDMSELIAGGSASDFAARLIAHFRDEQAARLEKLSR